MDCQEAQESILESLVEPLGADQRQAIDNHISTCGTCRTFAEIQRVLDARLAAVLPTARLSARWNERRTDTPTSLIVRYSSTNCSRVIGNAA